MTEKDNDSSSKSHVLFEKIPAELRVRKQWVLWGWGNNEGGKKTKVPKTLGKRGIIAAKSNDPASWLSFAETKAAYTEKPETFAGLMMALTAEDPYVFIDLDNAVDSEGHIKPWAQEITDQFRSYTELSVSGTGVHIIGQGKKDKKWTKSGHAKSKVCRTTYQDGEVEVYDEKRFVIFTGQIVLPERPITEAQTGLDWLINNVFASKTDIAQRAPSRALKNEIPLESDDKLLEHASAKDKKFRRLFSGDGSAYPSQSEADLALCSKIAF